MNKRFKRLIQVILQNEGGFVNDPVDTGGATKMGVSLRFLKSVGDIRYDLDNDGDIDIDDIRLITRDLASQVYFDRFYSPLHLDELIDDKLALQVLDHAVNAGQKSAVKMLQHVAGCKEDGLIGPKTIAAANTFKDNIARRYKQARLLFYEDLVEAKPQFVKYIHGWNNRVEYTYAQSCQF